MNWPLSSDSFSFWDRLKIAAFILNKKNQWTQGALVKKYEQEWSKYTRCPYVVMTASGSASNELIALYAKHQLQKSGQWPHKNKVIFPANTWISSVSVWLNLGFEPVFVDLDKENLCADVGLIEEKLKRRNDISYVFYTTLLGFSGNLIGLKKLCETYGAKLALDNCESSFSSFDWYSESNFHFCNFVTASTSLYFSHLTTTGSESGLIFCQNKDEYAFYLMARSHGMTRTLDAYSDILGESYISHYKNKDVEPKFDFNVLGSNYRSSDYLAFPGLIDFAKRDKYMIKRKFLYDWFNRGLWESGEFHLLEQTWGTVPFVLPIILKDENPLLMTKIKAYLRENSIEYRQIIGGHLLYQTAFKKYLSNESHPVSKHIHANGIYIGLNTRLNKDIVERWARDLSDLAILCPKL